MLRNTCPDVHTTTSVCMRLANALYCVIISHCTCFLTMPCLFTLLQLLNTYLVCSEY